MEPYMVICLACHNARAWHHNSDHVACPNGCDPRYTAPWFNGFGPDEKPVPRHPSMLYGKGVEWPDSNQVALHVNNMTEMRELCQ